MAGLACESNELSYEPFAPGVVLRAGGDVADDELTKAVFLAELTGTPLRISVPEQRPALPALAGGLAREPVPVTVESAGSLAASLAAVGAGGAWERHGCACWERPDRRWWPRPPRPG